MDSSSHVSRRNFLKTATLGGAALAAAPAWGRVLGANDRINVALIGVGCRGNDHLDLLLQHRENKPDIEIVALCDVYQKRLSMASRKAPGAKTYVHHQEVLQRTDIDAVFIATPDHWHAPITLGGDGERQGCLRRKAHDAHGRGKQSGRSPGEGTQARRAGGRAGDFPGTVGTKSTRLFNPE